jgi:CRP/FNR family transcriptional regulator, dissimilatory nitrate respiration regulator
MHEKLKECNLFRGLAEEQLVELFSSINYKEKKYKKDEIVAHSDDECRHLLIVLEGSVKGEMVDFSGKTIKIEDIESSHTLAPAFLFGQNNRYPVTIVANNNASILSISKDSFVEILMSNKLVLTNYLNNISNRAQFLSNKIRFLSFQTIKGKIAHYLLQVRQKLKSDEFIIPKSQNELSELFGVARPSLGRAMRELDNEGFIKADGKHIKIIDKEGLSGLLRD